MENLPSHISIIFILTTILTVFIFYRATRRSNTVAVVIGAWLLLQALISFTGWYTKTDLLPPPFMLAVIPPLLLIISLFAFSGGRRFIDSLNLQTLTLLHIIRIPVEFVLLLLFIQRKIPQLMTFEGHNFDILSGLTAPLICYYVFVKKASRKFLLAWNVLCLGLLLNIVVTAILSAPFRFQQLAFDQPNIAIFYFPFVWLPAVVVPLVLFAHLAAIRQLAKRATVISTGY